MTELLLLLFSSSFWLVKALFLVDWHIGEQHVLEDFGRIPTVADLLGRVRPACDADTSANLHRQAPPTPWHTSMARARQPDSQDENRC